VKCRTRAAGDACGLLQLRQTYAGPEMYGDNYGYRSSLNRSMVEHLHGKVRQILRRRPLRGGECVLDIGSNDGTLLAAYPEATLRVGMDPSAEKFRKYYPPGVQLVTDYFSAAKFGAVAGGRK